MKIQSINTLLILVSALILSACQTLSTTSSESNPLSISTNNYENEIYEPPTTLIPPIPDSDGDGILDDIDNCPKTLINFVVDANGCPINLILVEKLRMELEIFFERNSYELRAKYLSEIVKVAKKMNANLEQVLILSGHISEPEGVQISVNVDGKINNVESNRPQLGRARVQVIKDALVDRGIAADRIYTFDCAGYMHITRNDTEEGAARNQRIFGTIIEAEKLYDDYNPNIIHSFKYYKQMCQHF